MRTGDDESDTNRGNEMRNGTRTNKVRTILLKVIGAILIAIVLLLAIVYTVHTISTHSEQKN